MANKPQINYLARDFEAIKEELITYAKRFYPNQYKDFSDASFGSFLLDAIAYIGDVNSFQLDYQSNENLLTTAVNRTNVLNLARQMGYNEPLAPNISGIIDVYINVPATADDTPDTDYLPVLKAGSTFATEEGAVFSLTKDVDFSNSNVEFVVSRVDSTTGIPTRFAAKASGIVVSGFIETTSVFVEDQPSSDFYSTTLEEENIVEIISVFDTEGNEYYQVEALSQDIVMKGFLNDNSTASNTIQIMKPTVAARRFIARHENGSVKLIFGNGSENRNSSLDSITDPTSVVLQRYAKDYVSNTILDPTVLKGNDKFGIGPSNTELTIKFRANNSEIISAAQFTLNAVDDAVFDFPAAATNNDLKAEIRASLECENPSQIEGGRTLLTNDEVKQMALGIMASQGRVITTQDYVNFSYRMPAQFGNIKRAIAVRDDFSPRRAINLYVLSEDDTGDLVTTTQPVKDNLKTWLSQYKSISDSVDILDGRIINFGVRFSFIANTAFSLPEAISSAQEIAKEYFERRKYNFGESINIAELKRILNDSEQVVDITKMEFYSLSGGSFSDVEYNFIKNTTSDGRFITIPEDYVFEIKLFSTSITTEAI